MGGRRSWILLVAVTLAVTACNDAAADPTLATGTTAPPTTTPPTTTTSSTTTTAPPPTTTENPDARFQEIQRLAEATFVGRLNAIYHGDAQALLQWMGSQKAYDDSVALFDQGIFIDEPTAENVGFAIEEILLDRPDCIVARSTANTIGVVDGATGESTVISVYWPSESGVLLDAAVWQQGTPRSQWIEECDIAVRGVTP